MFPVQRYLQEESKSNPDSIGQKNTISFRKNSVPVAQKKEEAVEVDDVTSENMIIEDGDSSSEISTSNNESEMDVDQEDDISCTNGVRKSELDEQVSFDESFVGTSKSENPMFKDQYFTSPNTMIINPNISRKVSDSNLDPRIISILKKQGIRHLFPSQSAILPVLLNRENWRGDVSFQSPTGSGKSLCYILPIVHHLSKRAFPATRCVVVLPTRDLAQQVHSVFLPFCEELNLKIALCAGASSFEDEQSSIVDTRYTESQREFLNGGAGKCDIVVCTPGRLVSHLHQTEGFTLQHVRWLVVDEADRLLSETYQDWIPNVEESLYNSVPSRVIDNGDHGFFGNKIDFTTVRTRNSRRHGTDIKESNVLQKLLFSATMTKNPKQIASIGLLSPLHVISSSEKKYKFPGTLTEKFILCEDDMKPLIVACILSKFVGKQILVFTSSVEATHRLYVLMEHMVQQLLEDSQTTISIQEFSGKLRQKERTKIIKRFKKCTVNVLICSDAMSRGLDMEGVDVVVNYQVPNHVETYVHRVGRTARAGKSGLAFSLLAEHTLKGFLKMTSQVEGSTPSAYDIGQGRVSDIIPVYQRSLEYLRDQLSSSK